MRGRALDGAPYDDDRNPDTPPPPLREVDAPTIVRICRDEDCPQCGWIETFAEVNFSDTPPGARAFGCSKCGWRQEAPAAAAR